MKLRASIVCDSRLSIIWDDGSTTEWDCRLVGTYEGGVALKLVDPQTGKHKFYERN